MDKELEEAAENYGWRIKTNTFSDRVKANELANSAKQDFISGAKWQVDNMPIRLYTENTYVHIEDGTIIVEKNDQTIISYSEEEVLKILHDYRNHFELHKNIQVLPDMFFPWFEKVKKK